MVSQQTRTKQTELSIFFSGLVRVTGFIHSFMFWWFVFALLVGRFVCFCLFVCSLVGWLVGCLLAGLVGWMDSCWLDSIHVITP
jgi:hypothetical protein